jgi:DNA primase
MTTSSVNSTGETCLLGNKFVSLFYMVNHLLVNLVNNVIGVGKATSGANYSYHCPFCNHRKPKLEINFRENEEGLNNWHCWVCNRKGKKLITLFKAVDAPQHRIDELGSYVKISFHDKNSVQEDSLSLPKEYQPLYQADTKNISVRQALRYLKERGISSTDVARYQLGFCETGRYKNMIIIPSFDEHGTINYFVGRNFGPGTVKYKNPSFSKNIVPFELMINWESPIVLCEGTFDAMAIKRNAVPLLGKTLPEKLLKKIVSSKVKQVFIALDSDALKQALSYCQTLLNHGKEVFLVNMDEKDPSELGFENFTKLLHNSTPLTLRKLLEAKLQL